MCVPRAHSAIWVKLNLIFGHQNVRLRGLNTNWWQKSRKASIQSVGKEKCGLERVVRRARKTDAGGIFKNWKSENATKNDIVIRKTGNKLTETSNWSAATKMAWRKNELGSETQHLEWFDSETQHLEWFETRFTKRGLNQIPRPDWYEKTMGWVRLVLLHLDFA